MALVRACIVGGVAVVAGAVGLAISDGAAPDPVVRAAGEGSGEATSEAAPPAEADPAATTDPMAAGDPYWGNPALPVAPAPPGKEVIAFNDGGMPGLAGYIDDQGPNGWDVPDPVLDLGTGRYEARGVEITDLGGDLLGYAVGGVGLVDLATASDVEMMDALLADALARRDAQPEMTEDEARELFGVDEGG